MRFFRVRMAVPVLSIVFKECGRITAGVGQINPGVDSRWEAVYYHGGSIYTRHYENDLAVLHKAQGTVVSRFGSGCGYSWNNMDYNFDTAWVYMYLEQLTRQSGLMLTYALNFHTLGTIQ